MSCLPLRKLLSNHTRQPTVKKLRLLPSAELPR